MCFPMLSILYVNFPLTMAFTAAVTVVIDIFARAVVAVTIVASVVVTVKTFVRCRGDETRSVEIPDSSAWS